MGNLPNRYIRRRLFGYNVLDCGVIIRREITNRIIWEFILADYFQKKVLPHRFNWKNSYQKQYVYWLYGYIANDMFDFREHIELFRSNIVFYLYQITPIKIWKVMNNKFMIMSFFQHPLNRKDIVRFDNDWAYGINDTAIRFLWEHKVQYVNDSTWRISC